MKPISETNALVERERTRFNSLAVSVFVSEEPFERFGEDGRAIGFFGVGASVRLLASFFVRVVIYIRRNRTRTSSSRPVPSSLSAR